jgi:hypothetical protein
LADGATKSGYFQEARRRNVENLPSGRSGINRATFAKHVEPATGHFYQGLYERKSEAGGDAVSAKFDRSKIIREAQKHDAHGGN